MADIKTSPNDPALSQRLSIASRRPGPGAGRCHPPVYPEIGTDCRSSIARFPAGRRNPDQFGWRKARLWGVELEQVRLAMRARSRRSLAADIKIQAKKFFTRAKVEIYAQFDITNEFVVKISEMKCKGDGKLGSFACAALGPFFDKLKSETF